MQIEQETDGTFTIKGLTKGKLLNLSRAYREKTYRDPISNDILNAANNAIFKYLRAEFDENPQDYRII